MEITITCARCGAEFTPTRADVVRGTWRVCPDCRTGGVLAEIDLEAMRRAEPPPRCRYRSIEAVTAHPKGITALPGYHRVAGH